MGSYLDFVMTLFFAFGVAFEVPIATIILVWMGVVSPESLRQKRPYVVVGAFVVGMFLTPPDVISQTLLALPMWLLFELGLIFSKGFVRAQGQQVEPDLDSDSPTSLAVATAGAPPRRETATPVGRELDPAHDDRSPDRFVPLTDAEMEAELDAIDAEEEEVSAADKLLQVQTHRDAGEVEQARELLYEILEEGDADQRRVARNILAQLDTP
jgi:sec-independent protein translocase protein TatC